MISALTHELREVFKTFRYMFFKIYIFLIPNLLEWWTETMV